MKIVSVKHKSLKKLVQDRSLTTVKGLDKLQTRKIVDMLAAIEAMTNPLQLRTVPAWKAHELIPGKPNHWSLTVTANFRLTFYVDQKAQEVGLLNYEDYH